MRVIFEEVEDRKRNGARTPEHRIFPISQGNLLAEGSDDATPNPKYRGDKWGGKYLRAPDIYWTILEKGGDKLLRLGNVAEGTALWLSKREQMSFSTSMTLKGFREWGIEKEVSEACYQKPAIMQKHPYRSKPVEVQAIYV